MKLLGYADTSPWRSGLPSASLYTCRVKSECALEVNDDCGNNQKKSSPKK